MLSTNNRMVTEVQAETYGAIENPNDISSEDWVQENRGHHDVVIVLRNRITMRVLNLLVMGQCKVIIALHNNGITRWTFTKNKQERLSPIRSRSCWRVAHAAGTPLPTPRRALSTSMPSGH